MATKASSSFCIHNSKALKPSISAAGILIVALSFCSSLSLTANAATLLHGHLEELSPPIDDKKMTASLLPNSFPHAFAGTWKVETTVVDSGVSAVLAGQKSVSEITFRHVPDGRTVASWVQPGWTEAEASQVSFSQEKARVDRTNYYWADGVKGAWAARSRDDFTKVSDTQMTAKSYIDQYVDGQYVGRYRTVSTLYRLTDSEGLTRKN